MQAVALEAVRWLSERLIWPALLHSLWVALLAASCAALLLQLGRRLSHRSRHAILIMALLCAAIAPVIMVAVQSLFLTRVAASLRLEETLHATVISVGRPRASQLREPVSALPPMRRKPESKSSFPLFDRSRLLRSSAGLARRFRPLAVPVWLLGVSLLGALLAFGTRQVRRICRESAPASDRVQERCRELGGRLKLRRVPDIRLHPELAEPCLCGLFQPVILLPWDWVASCREDLLDAILAHELAHARRRDPLVNLVQRMVEILLFHHPAIHWLSRALRRERELCTDALAVRVTGNPLALAGALESVGRLRLGASRPALGANLGGEALTLLSRIQELIGMTPSRPRFSVWPFAALPMTALLAMVAVSAGLADEPAAASPRTTQQQQPSAATEAGSRGTERRLPKSPNPQPILRLDLSPGGGVEPAPLSEVQVRCLPAPQTDRLARYEVRLLSLDANPWRNLLRERLTLIQQDGDVSAWVIDAQSFTDLLKQLVSETASNAVQAPTVSTFENGVSTIKMTARRPYVASLENIGKRGRPALLPQVRYVDSETRLEISGSHTEQGTRLSLDLKDSTPMIHAMVRSDTVKETTIYTPYQVPTVIERQCRLSREVPEGSSLLISLGLQERRGQIPKGAETLIGILSDIGLPRLEPSLITTERLVLITPKWTVLEPEEQPLAPPAGPERRRP